MAEFRTLRTFKAYCQKVLPLVYDDSLSYYEVLCKVTDYINKIIENDEVQQTDIEQLQNDVSVVQKWIDDFDSFTNEQIEKIIAEYLKVAVFFEITDAGYFVANIPQTWDEIEFNTTGVDTTVSGVDYGHLVLSY